MVIFCTIYYIFSYIHTIPQVVKLIRTKSSNDYSLGMITLQLIAIISWSLYIFTSVQSIVVYVGTAIDLILLFLTDYLILKYYKFGKKKERIMYLQDYLNQFGDKKIKLFIDMDGVIADYIFDSAKDYDKKRPLYESIKKLWTISKMPNVELYIFSATRKSEGIEQKHWWLDTYAPYFKRENRIILSREDNNMTDSSTLKARYLKEYKRDDSIIIVIDDDPKNMREIKELNEDVYVLKDTALVD